MSPCISRTGQVYIELEQFGEIAEGEKAVTLENTENTFHLKICAASGTVHQLLVTKLYDDITKATFRRKPQRVHDANLMQTAITRARTHTRSHTPTLTLTPTHIHTRTHKLDANCQHVHTHTHTHTHTQTHM